MTTLIATKLNHRHNKCATVFRERLWSQFEPLLSDQYRLVAVETPAGYGKTTILSQWREQLAKRQVLSGWLSLDSADDDPMRFLAYLSEALHSILPNFDYKSAITFLFDSPINIDPLLAELNKCLSRIDANFILFLDDYHVINSRYVHSIISRLIRDAHGNMKFVIAGRHRPPLPYTQLKMNDQLIEISAEDLSFNTSEISIFLREIKGIGIDDCQINTLQQRAEGWIAGLQFAALAMKDTLNPKKFIDDFSGSDRDITDYLGEMVLDKQPREVRDFLLKTSVLERMNSSLCRKITGYEDSQAILERIESENLFLLPLDRDRNWYRYHQLFSDFLFSRLQGENENSVPELYRKASLWSQENGYTTEAVDYAFLAEDMDLAASIIAEKAPDLARRRGEMHTVLEWVKRLPPETVAKHPTIQIANEWCLTFYRRWKEAEEQLIQLEQLATHLESKKNTGAMVQASKIRSSVEMNRAIATTVQDHFHSSRKLCAKWLEDWPDGDDIDKAAIATALVYATVNTYEFEYGRKKYFEARRACERCKNYYAISWNFSSLGMIAIRQGYLAEAIQTYHEGLRYIEEKFGDSRSFMSSLLSMFMAEALYEANEIAQAEKYLTEARPFLKNHGTVEVAIAGYNTQARLQTLDGQVNKALDTLREGERLGYQSGLLRLSANMIAEQITLNLRIGSISTARSLAEEKGFLSSNNDILDTSREDTQEIRQLVKARLFMADSPLRSISIINELIKRAKKQGRKKYLMELSILKSKALWLLDKNLEAQREMDTALRLASPEGFIRIFVDNGHEVIEVIEEIINNRDNMDTIEPLGLSYEFLNNLRTAIHETTGGKSTIDIPAKELPDTTEYNELELIEKLTKREHQILQLMEGGNSNHELSKLLFISEQTVKWHVHNLYTKLGVRNRTGAISRARNLELLK